MAPLTAPAASLAARLRHTAIPAVLTPMTADRRLHAAALEHYAGTVVSQPVGGVAVWAHTGRGPYLTAEERRRVLGTFRAQTDKAIIAGVGGGRPAVDGNPVDPLEAVLRQAEDAAQGGADALLVFPPRARGPAADREAAVFDLHARTAERVGLPIVLFVLHQAAGGYPYSAALLRDLLALPGVIGVKVATLDSAMTCQDITTLVRSEFPERLSITGEDRMLGPSLMWGADAGLVGIAGAACGLTTDLFATWYARDHSAFIEASERLDRLALATFFEPIEGYVQRMLWVAEAEGTIPPEAAYDPFGPELPSSDRERAHSVVAGLGLSVGAR